MAILLLVSWEVAQEGTVKGRVDIIQLEVPVEESSDGHDTKEWGREKRDLKSIISVYRKYALFHFVYHTSIVLISHSLI